MAEAIGVFLELESAVGILLFAGICSLTSIAITIAIVRLSKKKEE